jgi:hypothetical protein
MTAVDIRAEYRAIAEAIGAEPAVIEAIAIVETGGRTGFLADGRPRILYEPHVFSRRSGHRFDQSHPHLSFKGWRSGFRYGKLTEQWDKFAEAAKLDRDAAIQACSWGRAQILGENWQSCGFASPGEFFWAMHSVAGQRHAVLHFAKADARLIAAVGAKNWREIARIYNGPSFEKHGYHTRLEAAYRRALATS